MNRIIILIMSILCMLPGASTAQALFRETVWLQLSRDIYLSGEEIEFTVCLLENDTYSPSVLSKNTRIEFTDNSGNSLIKQNIELTDSKASGAITIPPNLDSGWYMLRSYTNWMRNFPGQDFAVRYIRVLNPGDIDQDSIIVSNNMLGIEVYPAINPNNSVLSECAVFTTNEFGEGVSSEGIVLSGPGDTVLTFHTNSTGWGTSAYRPSDPGRYQVFALGYERDKINMSFIDPVNTGVQAVYSERYGYINLEFSGIEPGNIYKALVHRTYSWSWFQTVTEENGKISFRIPVRDLPTGISQITILDQDNRLIFKHLWSDYLEERSSVLIEKDPLSGHSDSEQIFEYYAEGDFNSKGNANAYVLADRYLERSINNNYLPGLPGWPSKYDIPAAQQSFDAWISCHSYPDNVALAFFAKNPDFPEVDLNTGSFHYLPETRGGTLQGTVYASDNKEPVENVYLALTVLNDNSHYAARTDKRGNFFFTFPGHSGQRDYLLNFIEEYEPSLFFEFTDEFDNYKPEQRKIGFSFSGEEISFLRYQKINSDLKRIYMIEEEDIILRDSLPHRGAFYGVPDISIKIDDYIQLPNLREVIYEVVPYVSIKQQKKKYEIQVAGEFLFSSQYPTLILMDGIPIYNYQELLNLPPERIDRIEVVTDFYIHGNAIYEGIVNIKSLNNDFGGLTMPSTTVLSTLLLPVSAHYYPLETGNSEIIGMPVLDQILKWDTLDKVSGGRMAVSLNDNRGKYRILIYGFDEEGRWYRGRLIFDVADSR